MENISCLKATLNDLQTVINLRLIFASEFAGQQSLESIAEFKRRNQEYLEKSIQNNSFIIYIARHGNELAGMGGMVIREQSGSFKNPTGKVGYLMNMYTFPLYRRRGICTNILKLLIEEASHVGITAIELHASPEEEFVYLQNGFEKHNEPTYRRYIE
jgi:predicted acetyltransferase